MCAMGAVVNILMMMTANLVGFVVGVDGVRFFLSELMGTIQGKKGTCCIPVALISRQLGVQFLVFVVVCLFVGVQVMFEYRQVTILVFCNREFTSCNREDELRNGISRRC